MSSSTSRRMWSNLPAATSRSICSSQSSSCQPWSQAASSARSSNESCSIAVLSSARLTALVYRGPDEDAIIDVTDCQRVEAYRHRARSAVQPPTGGQALGPREELRAVLKLDRLERSSLRRRGLTRIGTTLALRALVYVARHLRLHSSVGEHGMIKSCAFPSATHHGGEAMGTRNSETLPKRMRGNGEAFKSEILKR